MTRPGTSVVTGVVVAAVLALAGCAGGSDEREPPAGEPTAAPLADCAALVDPPPRAAALPPAGETTPLPEVTLPCFTGDEPVALAGLAGPAVVNLWASWCLPCREELPLLQRFAEEYGDQVHVLGVVTEDTRTGAASFARDAGVTFPSLYDRDGRMHQAVGSWSLPATLFVDAEGRVRYQHRTVPLDESTLAAHAAEHLGVATR